MFIIGIGSFVIFLLITITLHLLELRQQKRQKTIDEAWAAIFEGLRKWGK